MAEQPAPPPPRPEQGRFQMRQVMEPAGDQPQAIAKVMEQFRAPEVEAFGEKRFVTLAGATGTGKTCVIANVIAKVQRPVLILCHNKALASQLVNELRKFFPANHTYLYLSPFDFYVPPLVFMGEEELVYRSARGSYDDTIVAQRKGAIEKLTQRCPDTIVVASITALYGAGSATSNGRELDQASREVAVAEIARELAEVEAALRVTDDAGSRRLSQQVRKDLASIEATGWCREIFDRYGNWLPVNLRYSLLHHFHKAFGDDWMVVCDESHALLPQLKAPAVIARKRHEDLMRAGFRLPSAALNGPLGQKDLLEGELQPRRVLFVSATPGEQELRLSGEARIEMVQRPTHILDPVVEMRTDNLYGSSYNCWKDMFKEVRRTVKEGHHAIIIASTREDAKLLTKLFKKIRRGYKDYRCIRAACLHWQLTAKERQDVLAKFGRDELNVLVGINLLREGLDFPRIALVAVLDADGGGFLRTATSLTQIVGRAARNIKGKAILYGKTCTKAMEQCVNDANLRRQKQQDYNEKHNCKPQPVALRDEHDNGDWQEAQLAEVADHDSDDEAQGDDEAQSDDSPSVLPSPASDRNMGQAETKVRVLIGDRSTAMPHAGVPGVGPVIAGRMIEKHGTLEAIFEAARNDKLIETKHVGPKITKAMNAQSTAARKRANLKYAEGVFMRLFQRIHGPPQESRRPKPGGRRKGAATGLRKGAN